MPKHKTLLRTVAETGPYVAAVSLIIYGVSRGQERMVLFGTAVMIGTGCLRTLLDMRRARRYVERLRALGGRMCTECEYDLRGLNDAGSCPECGAAYDLNHPNRSK